MDRPGRCPPRLRRRPLPGGSRRRASHQPRIGPAGDDFRNGFVDIGASITDGTTFIAAIDWSAVITALDECGLPASGGEVLRLAALRDAFTGMYAANVDRAVRAPRRRARRTHARLRHGGPTRRGTTARLQQDEIPISSARPALPRQSSRCRAGTLVTCRCLTISLT
jgi:hypothetical protein